MADPNNLHDEQLRRRPRVCANCRRLKVRCQQSSTDKRGPCERCRRSGRVCTLVDRPNAAKLSDDPVTRLELKIDALFAHLNGNQINARPEAYTRNEPLPCRPERLSSRIFGLSQTLRKRSPSSESEFNESPCKRSCVSGERSLSPDAKSTLFVAQRPHRIPQTTPGSNFQPPMPASAFSEAVQLPQIVHDLMNRNVITVEMMHELFACFVNEMAPHFPIVIFPKGMTVCELGSSKPTLFLAVISAASAIKAPEIHEELNDMVLKLYANLVVHKGEKSLEIVQAIQVSTAWYRPPLRFGEINCHQLICMAAAMVEELIKKYETFTKRLKSSRVAAGIANDPENDAVGFCRAWLTSFILSTEHSLIWRRNSHHAWDAFGADCLDILESRSQACTSDLILCDLARLHLVPTPNQQKFFRGGRELDLAKMPLSYNLHNSAQEESSVGSTYEDGPSCMSSRLTIEWNSTDLHAALLGMMRQVLIINTNRIALSQRFTQALFQPPFPIESLHRLESSRASCPSPLEIHMMSSCMIAAQKFLDQFFSLEMTSLRCLPSFCFIQAIYSSVILMVSSIDHAMLDAHPVMLVSAKVNVEQNMVLLRRLRETFQQLSEEYGCLPALRLQAWLQRLEDRWSQVEAVQNISFSDWPGGFDNLDWTPYSDPFLKSDTFNLVDTSMNSILDVDKTQPSPTLMNQLWSSTCGDHQFSTDFSQSESYIDTSGSMFRANPGLLLANEFGRQFNQTDSLSQEDWDFVSSQSQSCHMQEPTRTEKDDSVVLLEC